MKTDFLENNLSLDASAGDLLSQFEKAFKGSKPETQTWMTAQLRAILSEVPFREAALSPPLLPPKEAASNRLLTAQEAAKLLNINPRWIYNHGKKLPHRRFGRYIRFPERDLLKWAEKQQQRYI